MTAEEQKESVKPDPKKGDEGEPLSDILTREQLAAEVKHIRRILNGLNNRLEKLDNALNAN